MDFVFLSTQAWDEMDGAGRPTHYLARELLARGARVLYFEFQASRAPTPTANLTLVLSTTLVEKLSRRQPRGDIQLLRQGYDPRAFEIQPAFTPPPNLARGERTLGFWGLVNHFNIDVELITHLAQARPQW